MSDLRSIATALEARKVDGLRLPALALGPVSRLTSYLEPTYVRRLPQTDGWGTPFQVESTGGSYSLRSLGRCGVAQRPGPYDYTRGELESLTDDLVITDNRWIRPTETW